MTAGPRQRILLVDDEPDILEFLSYTLLKEGFEVDTALDGSSALIKAGSFNPHLIILDLMMPGIDGIEVCRRIRSGGMSESVIICFLTARSDDISQVAGLESGGDDYIIKPVKPKVLISRVKALLRRVSGNNGTPDSTGVNIVAAGMILDRERFLLTVDGKDLVLPRKEFELLALLMQKPGKVFTRNEIFQEVWGENIIVGDRTIDVHIRKLREKIGDYNIQTIKGVGYKFIE